ncbi:hypothetical protein LUZ60_002679 [Juncus effusus]|nr:hypothetical protein LUZ60_002679 [Juncus effusus]
MVITCADSRVCPSTVLGFQPGEAFTVRNIANLVPPMYRASETKAALQFAICTLEVKNILVTGHSKCAGIQALMSKNNSIKADLMSLKDDFNSKGFIKDWVSIAHNAKRSTKAAAGNLSLEMQCQHCEKESINVSLRHLLAYPWIKKRVIKGKLSLHGGYYNFVDCTFEKWTLLYKNGREGGNKHVLTKSSLWS